MADTSRKTSTSTACQVVAGATAAAVVVEEVAVVWAPAVGMPPTSQKRPISPNKVRRVVMEKPLKIALLYARSGALPADLVIRCMACDQSRRCWIMQHASKSRIHGGIRRGSWQWLSTAIVLAVTGLMCAASAFAGANRGNRYAGAPWASRSPVIAQHGMAATEQPLASQAAVAILKKGGSAVDAAIAASAVLGLTEPVLNGIGGDAFAIVYDPKTHKLYGYNGSGPSPKARSLAQMQAEVKAAYKQAGMKPSDQIPRYGPLPVTVPGLVDTWFALHETFGKLPMTEDLAAAIRYAKNGFPVTEVVARYWKSNMQAFEKNRKLIPALDNAEKLYLIDGHAPRQGEIFKNPDLAHTLSEIAKNGRDAFYKGQIAHRMADFFKKIGADKIGRAH